jgi:protein-disulfide isomerase
MDENIPAQPSEPAESPESPELSEAPESPVNPEPLQESPAKAANTITFKRSHLYAVLLPMAFVLGLSVGYLFWGKGLPSPTPAVAAAPAAANVASSEQAAGQSASVEPTQQPTVRRYDIPVDDDPSLGPANAPLTLVEFSDFECPFCKRWQNEVFKPLMDAFPNQVRVVYRDFPLPNHPNSVPAAEAADCANEQGKFWEFHDRLFSADELNQALYIKIAGDLGLDVDKFTQCVQERRYQKEVQDDFNFAANLGVNSTPTFFLNGIPMVGAQPIDFFKQVFQKELAGEFPK